MSVVHVWNRGEKRKKRKKCNKKVKIIVYGTYKKFNIYTTCNSYTLVCLYTVYAVTGYDDYGIILFYH